MRVRAMAGILVVVAVSFGAGAVGVAAADQGTPSAPSPKVSHSAITPAEESATTPDNLYVPVGACRAADTRHVGIQGPGKVRAVQITGSTGFSAQGGTSSGCGIPAAATAVVVSLTALDETGAGYAVLYPAGTTRSSAGLSISYTKSTQITNTVTTQIGASGQIDAYVATSSTDLLFNVIGYYEPQIRAYVFDNATFFSRTSRVLSATHPDPGVYLLVIDTNVDACAASVTPGNLGTYAIGFTNGSDVEVKTYVLNADAEPVATDEGFNLTIVC